MSNPSANRNNEIDRLITALGIDLAFTGEEIADILWLSLKQQELGKDDPPKNVTNKIEESLHPESTTILSSESVSGTTSEGDSEYTPESGLESNSAPIYADLSGGDRQTSSKLKSLPLRIPDAPSLREPLQFARSLRTLMRRVNSGRHTILDEAETVNRTAANQGICIPILKAEPEPWLDLVLVVDESKSMTLWGHTVWELKRLLEHYGIFREVRTCGLTTDKTGTQIVIRSGIKGRERLGNAQELIDPTGRRLILVVSDCISLFWHDGTILPALKEWTKYQPMAILQMLPDWMWLKTGLRLGASVQLGNLVSGIANQSLAIKELLLWKEIDLDKGTKVPVLTLEPSVAAAWSSVVAGKSQAATSGFVFPAELQIERETLPQSRVSQLNAEDRVSRFRLSASPIARKLSGLLAAAPIISLPVVRLIQATLLPQSQPVHVAEVFLGGLLKPETEIHADTNPDMVQYKFADEEIRQIFLKDAPVSDSQDVFDAVSKYVEDRFGKSLYDFVALLKSPSEVGGEIGQAFAEIAFEVLKQLGGDYARFAEEIEDVRSAIKLLSFEFDIAEILFEAEVIPEALHLSVNLDSRDSDGFFTSNYIKDLVQNFEHLSPRENVSEVMLVFRTPEQRTWLVSTNQQVFFLLDDDKTRVDRQIIQYRQELGACLPVTTREKSELSGTFKLGNSAYWYYSKDILGDLRPARLSLESFINRALASIEVPMQLESFKYQVGTVKVVESRSLLRQKKTEIRILRQEGQGQQFIERLSDQVNLEMVAIPAGQFMMGAPESEEDSRDNERPQHEVSISTFFLGKYPITQAQYEAVMGNNPSRFKDEPDSPNHPVEQVSWDNATEFCRRLSEQTGKEYRLPSEAEWEYACRAGTTTPFHFGETLDATVANYGANSTYGRGQKGIYRGKTTPVGSFKVANAFGLYDMHGNVWEWCEDTWHSNYEGALKDGSAWFDELNKTLHSLRGGSWDLNPRYCRSAYRYYFADIRNLNIGFRVACSARGLL